MPPAESTYQIQRVKIDGIIYRRVSLHSPNTKLVPGDGAAPLKPKDEYFVAFLPERDFGIPDSDVIPVHPTC